MPLLVVAALLFAMMLALTDDRDMRDRFGFDAATVVGASSALFFVILVAHVQLRRELPDAGNIYMESFFFVMYLAIVVVVTNTYLFSMRKPIAFILYRDNLIPKALFWPLLIGSLNIITWLTFR